MGLGTEILFILMLGLLVLGPKQPNSCLRVVNAPFQCNFRVRRACTEQAQPLEQLTFAPVVGATVNTSPAMRLSAKVTVASPPSVAMGPDGNPGLPPACQTPRWNLAAILYPIDPNCIVADAVWVWKVARMSAAACLRGGLRCENHAS